MAYVSKSADDQSLGFSIRLQRTMDVTNKELYLATDSAAALAIMHSIDNHYLRQLNQMAFNATPKLQKVQVTR